MSFVKGLTYSFNSILDNFMGFMFFTLMTISSCSIFPPFDVVSRRVVFSFLDFCTAKDLVPLSGNCRREVLKPLSMVRMTLSGRSHSHVATTISPSVTLFLSTLNLLLFILSLIDLCWGLLCFWKQGYNIHSTLHRLTMCHILTDKTKTFDRKRCGKSMECLLYPYAIATRRCAHSARHITS